MLIIHLEVGVLKASKTTSKKKIRFFASENSKNDPLRGPKLGAETPVLAGDSLRNCPEPHGQLFEIARGAKSPESDFKKLPEGRGLFIIGSNRSIKPHVLANFSLQ